MTVHFIGAGPGAADLITLRGRDLLACCPVCLYAGSVVPPEMLAHCPPGARVVDTAPLTLDEIEALEESGDAVVFRPERVLIRSYERRVDRLAEAYVLGREQARREVDVWLEFCGM